MRLRHTNKQNMKSPPYRKAGQQQNQATGELWGQEVSIDVCSEIGTRAA